MDRSDLVLARKYIEENKSLLIENKNLLRRNVRELLDVLITMPEPVVQPLSQREMNIVHSWNAYALEFDLRGLKSSIKNNAELLKREDVSQYLNADAKVLLKSMSTF